MNMHLNTGLHNLDAIHGDEHLGAELTDEEADEISEAFWSGTAHILGPCNEGELLANLIAEDDAIATVLFQLCGTNPDLISHRARIEELLHKLTRGAQRLVNDQIHEGNISARDYS